MNDIQVAKALGWFSVGLGLTELLAGRQLAAFFGIKRHSLLVRLFGARELMAGVVVLAHPEKAQGLWARVAGDALDLAVLGGALLPGHRRRGAAALALAAVVGVTAADVLCAEALVSRKSRAIATAQRTRVKALA